MLLLMVHTFPLSSVSKKNEAENGFDSSSHYNLVHKPLLAVDKDWEMLEKLPAWKLAKREGLLTFATLMDLCHFKN